MTRIITIFLLTLSLINLSKAEDINVGYFAGGCFWCMEESFEKVDGVIDVVSGYSGGITKNPTYKDVIKGNTGHFETIKVIYDNDLINYDDLLKIYWKNVDPFDSNGQFCDKGYAYKSVIFYETKNEKNFIDISIKTLEKKFKKKIVTFVRKFNLFYEAEDYHQNYYKENFINYLIYKKNCKREQILKKIWN